MDRTDLDLIAALAAGTFPAAEAAALEARIASDPEAAAELAAQRRALAAAGRAARPRLAADESQALRAAVAARLGLHGDMVPARSRRRIPWGAVAVGASTLAAFLALAPVVGLLGDRGGDDSAMTAAGATVPSDEDARLDAASPEADLPPGDGGDTTITPTAVGAAPATTLATAFSERAGEVPEVAEDLALLAADPEAVQVLEQPADETTACLPEAEAYFGATGLTWFQYSATTEEGGTALWVVFHLAAPDGATGMLLAFDPADCTTPVPVPAADG